MKRKFLISYQSTRLDSFNRYKNFHTLIVTLDDIESEKQIPLKVFNEIHAHEKAKYDDPHGFDVMLINFWEIEP